jgi:hypothetical protein
VPGDQRRHELEANRDWRKRHLIMDGLLPIIRRVRRPLLPVEATTDAKPAVVPAKPVGEPVQDGQHDQRKETDGKAVASQPRK